MLYVAVNSRPYVAASVNLLAQKMIIPSETDFVELERVLAYLMSAKSMTLKVYHKSFDKIPLEPFCDAEWAVDTETRRSISGVICRVYGAPVIWRSRRQQCVALSLTEVEYYALDEAVRKIIWLRRLLEDRELQTSLPLIYCDNQSCNMLSFNENTKRSKRFGYVDLTVD